MREIMAMPWDEFCAEAVEALRIAKGR